VNLIVEINRPLVIEEEERARGKYKKEYEILKSIIYKNLKIETKYNYTKF